MRRKVRSRGDRWCVSRTLLAAGVPAAFLLAATGCSSTPGPSTSQLAASISTVVTGGWSLRTVSLSRGPKSVPLLSVSCASTTVCVAVGGTTTAYVAVTTDGGLQWKAGQDVPDGGLDSVACPTVSECLATGTAGGGGAGASFPTVRLTINGSTWSATPLPGPALQQVVCPTSTSCLGLTAGGGGSTVGLVSTSDLGATWQPVAGAPQLSAGQTSVTCTAAGDCSLAGQAVAGGGELILLSLDSGQSWRTIRLPAASSPTAVSCSTSENCVEVDERGGMGWTTSNAGRSWAEHKVDPEGGILNSITCDAGGRCLALGSDTMISGSGQSSVTIGLASVSDDDGRSWRASSPFQNSVPQVVSCVSDRRCVLVYGEIA